MIPLSLVLHGGAYVKNKKKIRSNVQGSILHAFF